MNGLSQITIDGEPIALKFGLPALRRIVEKMVEHTLITGEQYNELGIAHILFAGYVNACAMRDLPSTIPFEKFYEYVENVEAEESKVEITAAIRSFEESKYVKELTKKKVTESNAIPSTGTISNPLLSGNSD